MRVPAEQRHLLRELLPLIHVMRPFGPAQFVLLEDAHLHASKSHSWSSVAIRDHQWFSGSSEVIREDAHLAAVARLIHLVSRARPRQRPRLALIMGQLALDEHLAQLVGVDTLHAPQS